MQHKFILGRMIDTGSWIHQLDPRAKMTAMLLYAIVIILLVNSLPACLVVSGLSCLILYSTKIPLTLYWRAAKPLRWIMLFIFCFQLLLVADGTLLFSWGPIHLYSGGIEAAFFSVWRMFLFISFTALLTFTTTPTRLTQGLEDMLAPLRAVRVSPQKISLMLSIALRFIPTILDEAHKIVKAQASRGADLRELPWKEKAKAVIALLVPVTVCAFRRAEDLVNSMEARGYCLGAPRSKYTILSWRYQDTLFICIIVSLGILAVFI